MATKGREEALSTAAGCRGGTRVVPITRATLKTEDRGLSTLRESRDSSRILADLRNDSELDACRGCESRNAGEAACIAFKN